MMSGSEQVSGTISESRERFLTPCDAESGVVHLVSLLWLDALQQVRDDLVQAFPLLGS